MPTAVITMMPMIISLISQLPTVAASVEALVKAVTTMHAAGGGAPEIAAAIEAAIPDMTKAVMANTPHDPAMAPVPPQMPAG